MKLRIKRAPRVKVGLPIHDWFCISFTSKITFHTDGRKYTDAGSKWDVPEEKFFNATEFKPWFRQYVIQPREYQKMPMKFASAHYVANPNPEIYVFVDEEPSGLPDGIVEICASKNVDEFLELLEPYFILAKDK